MLEPQFLLSKTLWNSSIVKFALKAIAKRKLRRLVVQTTRLGHFRRSWLGIEPKSVCSKLDFYKFVDFIHNTPI